MGIRLLYRILIFSEIALHPIFTTQALLFAHLSVTLIIFMSTTMRAGVVLGSALAMMAFASLAFAASPAISVTGGNTPFSTISVSGSGFAVSEPVHVSLGLSSANPTADGSGAFSGATLTIPNIPSGLYLVIAVGQNSGQVAFAYLYVGGLMPSASPGGWYLSPGSTLVWSGSGWAPNEAITISRGGTSVASFSADAGGTFSAVGGSTVPFALHGGVATYTVHGATTGTTLTYMLGVADLYPYATPSAWYILPGSTVTFSGGGFGPSEGLSMYLGADTTLLAHGSADAGGSFTGVLSVTIPYGIGTAAYRIVGDESGAVANVPITRALFYPSLTPSAYYSAPGGFITMGGSGFAPNEYVDIAVEGTPTATAHADGLGAFSGISVHVPSTPNTTASMSGMGQTSGAVASFTMAVGAYYSWINLSSWYAKGGSAEVISGHNFAAGETVTAASGAQTLGSGVADINGDVTINATVPYVAPGPATINATGGTSGAVGSATMTVAPVYTDLQLGSYAGAPGGAVEFVGHGYLPGDPITVTTDRTGSTVVASFTADGLGDFDNSSWHVPANFAEGNLTLTVTGGYSFDTKSIVYYVTGE